MNDPTPLLPLSCCQNVIELKTMTKGTNIISKYVERGPKISESNACISF